MDAYSLAIRSRVDCIEVDVSRSSDGVLFALHNRLQTLILVVSSSFVSFILCLDSHRSCWSHAQSGICSVLLVTLLFKLEIWVWNRSHLSLFTSFCEVPVYQSISRKLMIIFLQIKELDVSDIVKGTLGNPRIPTLEDALAVMHQRCSSCYRYLLVISFVIYAQ